MAQTFTHDSTGLSQPHTPPPSPSPDLATALQLAQWSIQMRVDIRLTLISSSVSHGSTSACTIPSKELCPVAVWPYAHSRQDLWSSLAQQIIYGKGNSPQLTLLLHFVNIRPW